MVVTLMWKAAGGSAIMNNASQTKVRLKTSGGDENGKAMAEDGAELSRTVDEGDDQAGSVDTAWLPREARLCPFCPQESTSYCNNNARPTKVRLKTSGGDENGKAMAEDGAELSRTVDQGDDPAGGLAGRTRSQEKPT
ncbi:unnamed protein product [Boreogadus saida]